MQPTASNRTSTYLQRCLDNPRGDDVPTMVRADHNPSWLRDWLGSVVAHQYEGLHHYMEGFVSQTQKGKLAEVLDDAWCRLFVRTVPDMVRRLQMFDRAVTEHPANETVQVYFQQAMRCYVLGLPVAAVALARACLEQALRETLPVPDREQPDLKGLLMAAERSGRLNGGHLQMAKAIQRTANKVLHHEPCTDDEAMMVIDNLRAVAEQLYGPAPDWWTPTDTGGQGA